jgi:serine/threonine protein kinase/Tfp pilus assembly protein PilF
VISALRLCPKCGGKIPADAPEGGCPGCLLESGLGLLPEASVAVVDDVGHVDKLDSKKAERAAAMLGELGDYELLEEVGRGGQGVVFRARQKSLNRTVALKVISLGQWASKAHLKRFRREAEAAASLDHPSIVPIYEVGERDGSCYFSMKFVEGGQLDEVIRRRPISIRQAAKLIAKLARTVHYAHEHGILHRDIKPGNILLDAKGEPHLTDFGLARLVETESTVTRTLEVLGTPSYMAPEQAAGNRKLSGATDVYGLGAVLYQLLTGHPPFAGGTTFETVRLVLDTEPRQPRLLNPKIGRDLSTICLKCLEKDPTRRYASALALAEDLEHWLRHEPIHAKRSGFFTHVRKWVRRNPTSALLVASLIALAAAMGWNVWKSELVTRPAAKGIAVLPFENLSHDPDNAYFTEGIEEEILTRLASIANLRVISRSSTQQYQNGPRNLSQIAKQLGVANILEGSVQKAADQVRVNVQLIDARTDSHLWAQSYDRKLTDIFAVQTQIAREVADALQVNLTAREKQTLAVKPTNNLDAHDAYLRGLAFEARSRSPFYSPDLVGKATAFYQQAVQLDPNFALAWARLSRANAYIYNSGTDSTPAARREIAKTALDNAQKLELNSPETLLALGYYQYWVLRDYERAKITFDGIRGLLPSSSEVPHALGLIARREGQWEQSVTYLQQALALDPRNVRLLMNSAETYAVLRQFPAALKLYDRVLDILPNDLDVMAAKATVYQGEGDLKLASSLLSEITEQTPNEDTIRIKVTQLQLERNYSEAVRLLQARQAQFHFASEDDKANDQVTLAMVQRLAGDAAGAKITAEPARNTFQRLYLDQSDNFHLAAQLSQAYAAMGEKDSALKAAERAIVLRPRAKDRMRGPALEENLALIQTMFGENSRAISTLRELLQTPYNSWVYSPVPITPALLKFDPIWDPLRGDPAFQRLSEKKQP